MLRVTNMEIEIRALLEFLEQTPASLGRQLESLSDSERRLRKADGNFSFVEDVCHLRDLEIEGYAQRIARILNEDQPVLADFDGGLIAAQRNYNSEDAGLALEAFAIARQKNLECVRALPAEQLERAGVLEGVGRVTLKRLLTLMKEHDEGHLQMMGQP